MVARLSSFFSDVLGTALNGFSTASSAAVTASDSVLSGLGKLQAQENLKAPLASPTFTGTVTAGGALNSPGPITYYYNANGTIPPGGGQGVIEWNYTAGAAECDYWNCYGSAITSHIFWQRTSAGAATRLLDIGPTGNVTAYGSVTAQATAGSWSGYNWGKELLITTTGGANNPALGFTDSNGANLWGISVGGGLNFAQMPALTDSTTAPTFVLNLSSSGSTLYSPLNVTGLTGLGGLTSTPTESLQVDGNINTANGGNTGGAGGYVSFSVAALPTYSPMAAVKGSLINSVGTELQGSLSLQVRPFNASAGQVLTEVLRLDGTSLLAVMPKGAAISGGSSTIDGAVIGGTTPASGTFTALAAGTNASAGSAVVNGPAGSYRTLHLQTAGSDRWALFADNSSESGANAGSNFNLNAYSDAAAVLFTPFIINRASGLVTMNKGAVISGGSSTIDGAAIGGTTPAAGHFTTLSATSTISGAGFTAWAASPPAIGGTTPAAGTFTTLQATTLQNTPVSGASGSFTNLSASGTVSGTGITNLFSGPPGIGGATPNTGAFTTLSATGTVSVGGNTLAAPTVAINGAAGFVRGVEFETAGVERWLVGADSSGESGSNAGSNYVFQRWSDAGSLLSTPVQINRATGQLSAVNGVSVTNGLSSDTISASTGYNGPVGQTTPAAGTFTTLANSAGYVSTAVIGRNKLHNPLFNIQQRGAGAFTANSVYTADRWLLGLTLDTDSVTVVALTDTDRGNTGINDEEATYGLSNTFTGNAGASAYSVISQRIETVRRLSNKTVTVSFWAKAASGTPKVGVSIDQVFGTGGSPSATVTGNGTAVTLSTSWARYSVTLAIASASGKTFGTTAGTDFTQLNIWYSSGTTDATRAGSIGVQSATVSLWGVQLEIGSVATPLEKPDPAYDLANCLRFFQGNQCVITGYGAAGAGAGQSMTLLSFMRASPTMTLGTAANSNVGTVTLTPLLNRAVWVSASVTATGAWTVNQQYTASADL
jgi:hypothetical protein